MHPEKALEEEDLPSILPPRCGLSLPELLQGIFAGVGELAEWKPDGQELALGPRKAVLYSEDPEDEGSPAILTHCSDRSLAFHALGPDLPNVGSVLILLDTESHLLGFESVALGQCRYQYPQSALRRLARRKRRLPVRGTVHLHQRDGRVFPGRIHDFSPKGVSFILESMQLQSGEHFLANIEIPDCGNCETILQVRRIERYSGNRILVAATLQSTANQRQQIAELFHCACCE